MDNEMSWNWFNVSAPMVRVPIGRGRTVLVTLWNAFNRKMADPWGHHWGFGLLQIGNRHLFYVGNQGLFLFWVGRTQ